MNKLQTVTKPGEHGTLHLYTIVYTCKFDECIGEMNQRIWAYNIEHAVDKFYEAEDSDGWTALRIARVPASGAMHRASYHAI